jgi:hypothetical protein
MISLPDEAMEGKAADLSPHRRCWTHLHEKK